MAEDTTEEYRRARSAEIAAEAGSREVLEARYGRVWNTEEVTAEFEVLGFGAPLVTVIRKVDRRKGSLEFQARPRFYFNFVPHEG